MSFIKRYLDSTEYLPESPLFKKKKVKFQGKANWLSVLTLVQTTPGGSIQLGKEWILPHTEDFLHLP